MCIMWHVTEECPQCAYGCPSKVTHMHSLSGTYVMPPRHGPGTSNAGTTNTPALNGRSRWRSDRGGGGFGPASPQPVTIWRHADPAVWVRLPSGPGSKCSIMDVVRTRRQGGALAPPLLGGREWQSVADDRVHLGSLPMVQGGLGLGLGFRVDKP